MAGILQTISVRFIAQVAEFQKGLSKMTKDTVKWSGGFKKESANAIKNFKLIGGAAIGAATALGGAFVAAVVASTSRISELVDQANQLGMSLQQWQAFAYIAETTGASAQKLAQGVGEMQKKIADAATGSTQARAAFDVLGIKFEELTQLSPDEQLKVVSEALKNVTDKTLQAKLGTEIFGGSWRELNPILTMGVDNLQALQLEAAKMGQALSSVDAQNVKDMAENFDKAKNMVMGLFNVISANIAPVFNSLYQAFEGVAKSGDNFVNVGQLIQDVVVTAIYMVIKAVDYLRAGIKGGESVLLYLTGGFFAMAEAAVKAVNYLNSYVEKGFNKLIDAWNNLSSLWGGDQVAHIDLQFTQTAQYLEDMRKGVLEDAGKTMTEAGQIAGNGWAESFLKVVQEKMPTFSETTAKAEAEIVRTSEATRVVVEEVGAGIDVANNAAQSALETQKKSLDEMKKYGEDARGAFHDFFKDALSGSKSLGDSFKDLINRLLETAMELLVIKPLMDAIFGSMGGGGGGGWIGAIAGMFGKSASGGFIPGGVPRYVHKNELVVPAADSYVVNSRKVNSMMSDFGGAPNLSYNIYAYDTQSVERVLERNRPKLAQDALMAWSAARARRKIA